MADLGADGADSRVVDEGAGVAVVPVLVGKLTVSDLERARLTVHIFVLEEKREKRDWEGKGWTRKGE